MKLTGLLKSSGGLTRSKKMVATDLKIETGSSILLSLDLDVEANCLGLRLAPNMAAEEIIFS